MTPRFATADDVPAIAALHVQAWEETYVGLVPPEEFARCDLDYRIKIWGDVITAGKPLSYIPDVGFAYIGPNRDAAFRDAYPLELFSFYTLKHAHGSGAAQALLAHAFAENPQPFTAACLKGNDRAMRFYDKIGGVHLKEIHETRHGWHLTDVLFGWSVPIQSFD